MCGRGRSGMAPRRKCKRTTTRRRTHQRGGIIPLILMAGKAIASSAVSSGAKYGIKKALEKRRRRTHQRGGIIPLILMAGKAIASSAVSSGAKYGIKKALEKA